MRLSEQTFSLWTTIKLTLLARLSMIGFDFFSACRRACPPVC